MELTRGHKFTASEHGFFVSAALKEYGSDAEISEHSKKYGELTLEHVGWGNEPDPTAYYRL